MYAKPTILIYFSIMKQESIEYSPPEANMLIIDKADNFKHPRTRKIKFNRSQMCGFKIISFNICS